MVSWPNDHGVKQLKRNQLATIKSYRRCSSFLAVSFFLCLYHLFKLVCLILTITVKILLFPKTWADTHRELSTQQTIDFRSHFEDEWILFPPTWLRRNLNELLLKSSTPVLSRTVWPLEVKVLVNHACPHLSLWQKPLLAAQHLPVHMVYQRGKKPFKWQGEAVFLRRLETTLNGLWRYDQIGPHQGTTSHSALIFVNCFRNELLAVSICVEGSQKEWWILHKVSNAY